MSSYGILSESNLSLILFSYLFSRKKMKMAETTEQQTQNPWMCLEQCSRVEINGHDLLITEPVITDRNESVPQVHHNNNASDSNLGIGDRAFSAAGAAFLSAIIVNPLDVAKIRLQAQAAGVAYSHPLSNLIGQMACFGPNTMFADLRCSPSCTCAGVHGTVAICPPDCFQYKGTLDVFNKIIRQEGFSRLWRGTNAAQAFKDTQIGKKPPGVFSTLLGVLSNVKGTSSLQGYRALWTGMGAQLAHDVPFSGFIRRRLLGLVGEESNIATVLGTNFSAGFVAGSLAAAATCPLDVAKTRRQIEKDAVRALQMTTQQTLKEVWSDGGMRGLFTGVGPCVGRAGPSVGIVVSFYEVVKYVLHHHYATS
ncbi:hypothetical protein PTKIN_Ptkin04bG0144300 [Pterospermum kingtungense]